MCDRNAIVWNGNINNKYDRRRRWQRRRRRRRHHREDDDATRLERRRNDNGGDTTTATERPQSTSFGIGLAKYGCHAKAPFKRKTSSCGSRPLCAWATLSAASFPMRERCERFHKCWTFILTMAVSICAFVCVCLCPSISSTRSSAAAAAAAAATTTAAAAVTVAAARAAVAAAVVAK